MSQGGWGGRGAAPGPEGVAAGSLTAGARPLSPARRPGGRSRSAGAAGAVQCASERRAVWCAAPPPPRPDGRTPRCVAVEQWQYVGMVKRLRVMRVGVVTISPYFGALTAR